MVMLRGWALELAAQRESPAAGPGARLTPPGLCFLTCEMGTVTVPWFLGLNSKAPRTGWHRGCPQPCCLFPSPGGCGSRGESGGHLPQAVLSAASWEGGLGAGTA